MMLIVVSIGNYTQKYFFNFTLAFQTTVQTFEKIPFSVTLLLLVTYLALVGTTTYWDECITLMITLLILNFLTISWYIETWRLNNFSKSEETEMYTRWNWKWKGDEVNCFMHVWFSIAKSIKLCVYQFKNE